MTERIKISVIIFVVSFSGLTAQDSLDFRGQLSAYTHFNPRNTLPWWNGARYIPQLNYGLSLKNDRLVDFEASANLYGNIGIRPFDSTGHNGNIKPYRFWARWSSPQFEVRAGLQKINFGSASILRPLMWFDQIDPRDPLKLTDGTWGVLARYYFLNNANIWLWGLYGNNKIKGWETFTTERKIPEYGSRIQVPLPRGETAISFHHRMADCSTLADSTLITGKVPENRFGFDAKLDVVVGCWIEASWSRYSEDLGILSNQEIINIGLDYTFAVGNGLTVIYEHLIAAYDEKPFSFSDPVSFSLFSLSYPAGLFDHISTIIYYDWNNNRMYNFVNWQRQFNKLTLYLMGYINPREYKIPTQQADQILYAGTGLQVMLVFNH